MTRLAAMEAEDRPVERRWRWWWWLRDAAVVAATAVVTATTYGWLRFYAAFISGGEFYYDPQGPEQVRDSYTFEVFFYLTSGQWVGLLVPLIVGAVLMFLHSRTARVLPQSASLASLGPRRPCRYRLAPATHRPARAGSGSDLKAQLTDRDDDLAAARATNRELMVQLNAIRPRRS